MATQNLIALLAQLPANLHWAQAKSLVGKPSDQAARAALTGAGLSVANVDKYLNGGMTGAQLISTQQSYQLPSGQSVNPSAITNTIGQALGFLTSGKNWLRMGEVVAGVILIVMGLRTLAGHDTTPVSVTTGAAKGATKAAMRSVY